MTEDSTEILNDLANKVAAEFEAHRQPEEFKDISIVIQSSDEENPTLIVHIDKPSATSLADCIEEFLEEQGARTERERHSETDIRVLAMID